MIIGLTVWGQRISPVFDSAQKLMIVDIQNSKIVSRRYETFEPEALSLLSEKLKNFNIDVLICGAISKEPAGIIESAGINCISFISGHFENVLESYIGGEVLTAKYIMPGFGEK